MIFQLNFVREIIFILPTPWRRHVTLLPLLLAARGCGPRRALPPSRACVTLFALSCAGRGSLHFPKAELEDL
jgi:hypothetical protein